MKTRIIQALIIVLLVLLCGWGLDWLFTNVPGYVLIAVNQTSLELNLWFALVALVATVLVVVYGFRLMRWCWRLLLPLLGFKSPENYTRMTNRGLLAYLRGEHDKAQKWLMRSAKKSPVPLVNLLAAADSAHALGSTNKALAFLDRARPELSEQKATLALARAEIFRRAGDHDERLQVLLEASERFPKDSLIQDRLCDAYVAVGQWQQVRALLPKLRKRLPKERWQELQAKLLMADINQLTSNIPAGENSNVSRKLQMLWLEQSASLQQRPEVLKVYVQALVSVAEGDEAEAVLRKFLRHHWHQDVVIAYGLLKTEAYKHQLDTAEHWLNKHGHDWALLLTCGRLCLRNQLWGQAQAYFERSLQADPSIAAFGELARLLANLGKYGLSQEVYQKALQMGAAKLPELPQPVPK